MKNRLWGWKLNCFNDSREVGHNKVPGVVELYPPVSWQNCFIIVVLHDTQDKPATRQWKTTKVTPDNMVSSCFNSTKRGLPKVERSRKSRAMNAMKKSGSENLHDNRVLVVVRGRESLLHYGTSRKAKENSLSFNTTMERCVRHYEKSDKCVEKLRK